jgi:hypothetical protein
VMVTDPRRSIFDRIVYKVNEQLLQSIGIAKNQRVLRKMNTIVFFFFAARSQKTSSTR